MWKNSGLRNSIAAVCLLLSLGASSLPAQSSEHGHTLLLTPQHLRRLERDRERQTVRWLNFERRVETVPDSPERGFELALYYAVTHDPARGREAVAWAAAHSCEQRQVALIMDWTGELVSKEQRQRILHSSSCGGASSDGPLSRARNALFMSVADGGEAGASYGNEWKQLRPDMEASVLSQPSELYALCEFLMTMRMVNRVDLRQENATFFRLLPEEFLLGLKPGQVEHPDWMAHTAALALVAVDPNLDTSQFLQGWAMEENQTITQGPGVAYEFLWADPYLPGIAYRNMEPWVYDPAGRLFARTGWEADACWVAMAPGRVDQANCPDLKEVTFGNLRLAKMTLPCILLPARGNHDEMILWNLKAGQSVIFRGDERDTSMQADTAGMWEVPSNANGKVCAAREGKR